MKLSSTPRSLCAVSDGNPGSIESALKRVAELEESHEELAARQDETDTSVVKVLEVVQRIERMVRAQLQHNGVPFHG